MDLRVDYYYDQESEHWGFSVPSLRIIGSAETREKAEEEAHSAILFALEGDGETEPLSGGEFGYFRVTLEPVAATQPV